VTGSGPRREAQAKVKVGGGQEGREVERGGVVIVLMMCVWDELMGEKEGMMGYGRSETGGDRLFAAYNFNSLDIFWIGGKEEDLDLRIV